MRSLLLAATMFAGALAVSTPVLAADLAAPPAAAGVVPLGKLSDAVVPSAYRLDLTLDPAKPGFSGHVEIDARVARPSRYVWLHGRNLDVARVTATAGGKTLTGTFEQVDPTGVALLTFPEALPAGPVTFAFDYTGTYGDGPSGLFHVKVGGAWYGWSQFESIDARAAFPAFDQPGFKTPFTITLRTPKGLKAVSNAPETSQENVGGMTVHHFAQTLPLPTYLVAMMAGPFVTLDGAVPPDAERAAPLPLRIVSTRPNAGKLHFALEGSKGIVEHLEAYFGQPFPFPKLDQITSPVMPGAMENAGADLYEDSILVMGDDAPTSQKRAFGMVVAHELSHQWFGDLVTPAWWDDIWLNESFANWMGYRIGNEWRPDLNIGAGALAEGFSAMSTDALLAGRPIHQAITRNDQIDAAFDSITYGKGGQVVAMIAAFMGDTRFRDGVRDYLKLHKYGNASSSDFFKAMADTAGDPRLLAAMQSFTDQQGVPLVTFAPDGGDGWTVAQSRYARLGTTPPPTMWGIPLCARQGKDRECKLMDGKTMTLQLDGSGPVVPNAGGTGYYRFELPAAQWNELIAAAPRLPAGEALAVEDSLSASFLAGRASPAQVIAGARALAQNPDSYASDGAISLLSYLASHGVIGDDALPAYRKLVASIYAPQLARLGFDPRKGAYAGEDPETAQRRVQLVGLLARDARDQAIDTRLATAAAAWLGGDKQALDPSFMGAAFGALLRRDKLTGAKTLIEHALASEDPRFRPYALGAIGGSDDPAIARWLLDEFKDKRLRPSERLHMVLGVLYAKHTRDFGYSWMTAHVEELLKGGAGIFFAQGLPASLSGFCSSQRADEIAALKPKFAGNAGALELDRAIERVRDCGVLKDRRGAEMTAAMKAAE